MEVRKLSFLRRWISSLKEQDMGMLDERDRSKGV